jgi:hypothetical protein
MNCTGTVWSVISQSIKWQATGWTTGGPILDRWSIFPLLIRLDQLWGRRSPSSHPMGTQGKTVQAFVTQLHLMARLRMLGASPPIFHSVEWDNSNSIWGVTVSDPTVHSVICIARGGGGEICQAEVGQDIHSPLCKLPTNSEWWNFRLLLACCDFYSSTLKLDVVLPRETSITFYQTVRCNIP